MISRLYVEQASDIEQELYLGVVFDRASERVMIIATAEGGMDIEEVAEKTPDAIKRLSVEPAVGLQAFQARELAFELGLDVAVIGQAAKTILGVYRAFRDLDCNMFEINPLVVTKDKHLLALDAKMGFDENALFRQPEIAELRDATQEAPRETAAADQGLSYVGLDGDIGCMINGAGLAMATMDMIKHVGGEPANFLDIGGGASPERVGKALDLVLEDKSVKAILVNIFAGINRCDWVAQGVVDLLNARPVDVPLVVRLSGTNVEAGQKILRDSNTNVITADTLEEAARKVVAASKAA
jgi:malate-CoA ligase subunit beta